MKRLTRAFAAAAVVATTSATSGCDPYGGFFDGERSLGAIDPVRFPAANLGSRGSRTRPGQGVFREIRAFAGGAEAGEVGYFAFGFPPGDNPDPLLLASDDVANPDLPTPDAFVFDGDSATPRCRAPAGYQRDVLRDEYPRDEQGTVFTALPEATYNPGVASTTTYLPVVRELVASAEGRPCQQMKSGAAIAAAFSPPPAPSGRLLAFLIIDPSAAVYRFDGKPPEIPGNGDPGLGVQRWGWYARYQLAYLDGGAIPTREDSVSTSGPQGPTTVKALRMKTQRLYHPRSLVVPAEPDSDPAGTPGKLGQGYDVLQARRGEAAYSPVCEVLSYDAGVAPVPEDKLPRRAEIIEQSFGATLTADTPRFVFCLQVPR